MKPLPPSHPDWKAILLAGPDWPKKFAIPQKDSMAEGSESILESMFFSEHWEWELWRHPDGHCYYLKVWPIHDGKYGDPKTPGAALTVTETFQFLITNWMPRDGTREFATSSLTFGSRLVPVRAGQRNSGQRSIEIALTGVNDPASAQAAVQQLLEKIIVAATPPSLK